MGEQSPVELLTCRRFLKRRQSHTSRQTTTLVSLPRPAGNPGAAAFSSSLVSAAICSSSTASSGR
jgi:hypothetical protein